MTPHRASTGIAALDELGRRLDAVAEPSRLRRLAPRRWAAVSCGILALAATPAIASVTGIFDGAVRVEDKLPEVAASIDRDDPVATGRALERRGFHVNWVLITDNPGGETPTRSRAVAAPPAGTEILAVLDEDGSNAADSGTRVLMIEVSPAGSDILETHR